jgi:hypothetical protein
MYTKSFLSMILIVFFVACSKQKEEPPILYVPAKNEVLTKTDSKMKLQDFFKARYTKFDPTNQCWIRITKEGRFCLNLHVVATRETNLNSFIYVVESGTPMANDGTLANYHASSGVMTLFLLGEANDQLNLIAQSETFTNGGYGTPNEIKTYRAGNDGLLGFIVPDGGGNMGYFSGGISLYLQKDNQIVEVASLSNYSDNSGACGDSSSQMCDLKSINSVIETIYDSKKRYFDIKVATRDESKVMGKAKQVKDTVKVISFDDKKFAYEIGDVNQPYVAQ